MVLLTIGTFLILIAVALIGFCTVKSNKEKYIIIAVTAGAMFLSGITLNAIASELSPAKIQNICEENNICYELVQTIAENTNYTEKQVTDFFIIVSDDIEAWDAIKMLDSSLTNEQINAIMEISEMKQAE